jgi:hypothetical protein
LQPLVHIVLEGSLDMLSPRRPKGSYFCLVSNATHMCITHSAYPSGLHPCIHPWTKPHNTPPTPPYPTPHRHIPLHATSCTMQPIRLNMCTPRWDSLGDSLGKLYRCPCIHKYPKPRLVHSVLIMACDIMQHHVSLHFVVDGLSGTFCTSGSMQYLPSTLHVVRCAATARWVGAARRLTHPSCYARCRIWIPTRPPLPAC